MASRRPQLWLVRERYEEMDPAYRGLVFGVFNSRKQALLCRKAVTGGGDPEVAVAEIVPLDLNYTYGAGCGGTKSEQGD